MKTKELLLISAISATSMIATSVQAIDFNTTFTGDNEVLNFSYTENGGSATSYDLSTLSAAGLQNWGVSSSLSLLGLANNTTYEFIWEVENYSGPSGFLAEFTLGSDSYLSSDSSMWEVSNDGITWSNVTSYGTNSISDPNIWPSIAGIDTTAEWIWGDSNNTPGEDLFFKASVVSPVPEPSTYALMIGGLGLVGFMAARRRKAR